MAYVYLHRKKTNGEVFYVGIGSDNKGKHERAHYLYNRGRNKHWLNVYNKHGYIVEITHDNLLWEEACCIEIYLILFYGRKDLGTGTLVNKTIGGEGVIGTVMTEERRKKLSESKSGKNHPHYGKHLPEETRRKIGIAQKGKKLTAEHIKKSSEARKGLIPHNKGVPMSSNEYVKHLERMKKTYKTVAKYNLLGEIKEIYDSVKQSAIKNNLGQGNITNACNKKIMYGGFLWRYAVGGEFEDNIDAYKERIKPILQIGLNNDIISEYASAKEAARRTGFVKSTILRALKRKNNLAYNFKWIFKPTG